MKKNVTPTESVSHPYYEMHSAILKVYNRPRYLVPSVIVGMLSAAIGGLFGAANKLSVLALVMFVVMYGFLGLTIPLVLILLGNNLFPSDAENKMVLVGIKFLKSQNYAPHILESIERRAELGNTAGTARTLIPILALSISLPILITQGSFATTTLVGALASLLAVIFLISVVFAFVSEIDRANIDAIVSHSCVEYRCEQQQKKKDEQAPAWKLAL